MRRTPSSTAVRRQDFTVCLLLSSVRSPLNSSVLFPSRRLQPVVQPHHVSPRAEDAHVQAASQKPLQQRQRRRSWGAFALPCASSSSSAHAFHPAAEGQRQRARQRLSWRVRTAGTFICDNLLYFFYYVTYTAWNNFLCLWIVDVFSFVSLFLILMAV